MSFAADLDRDARRALVEGSAELEGIDFVEVLANRPGTPGHVPGAPAQRTLLVHLLNRAVPAGWDRTRVAVRGGVRADPRINPVSVVWAYPAAAASPPGVTAADRALVAAALPPDPGRVFVVRTSSHGDWSTYTLHLLDDAGVPDGFDEPLAQCPFSFTVDCPSDLDCAVAGTTAAAPVSAVVPDYLARDYDALRTRLLDRMSVLMPDWTDRSPADTTVMLAELFASLGDRLAYWQDAVGREAYLGTAAQRTSVRRHARLLDYRVHEGCAARAWLAVTTDVPTTLRAGAPVTGTAGTEDLPLAAHEAGSPVFETCAEAVLHPARNRIDLHSWGDPDHVLPAGSRSAYLAVPTAGGDPGLIEGDVLVLVDSPGPGADLRLGDPATRFVVRLDAEPVVHTDPIAPGQMILEVHWHAADALPAALRVAERGPDGDPVVRAVAMANVVLADHGASVPPEPLVPPQPDADGLYRPRLARTGLAHAEPLADPLPVPAAELGAPDPRRAVAQLGLDDGQRTWAPVFDLIVSSRLDPHFVVEPADGVARLRFGDGSTGRRPAVGSVFTGRYRLGGGTGGNLAADRLSRWLHRPDGSPAHDSSAALTVWNPLPATGGTDPEQVAAVQQLAPSAFRTQLRAVTAQDHAEAADTVSGVQRAVTRRMWTGSWYAMRTMVDADAGADPFAAVATLLETRRMVVTDVEVAPPAQVPLHIGLFGCVLPGFLQSEVRGQILAALSAHPPTGFFNPDRFTFGQPLYVSDLVAAAMAVPGLTSLDVRVFAPLGAEAQTAANLAAGRIVTGPREVLRCDTDPNNPEAGRVDVELGGGS